MDPFVGFSSINWRFSDGADGNDGDGEYCDHYDEEDGDSGHGHGHDVHGDDEDADDDDDDHDDN